MLNYKPNRASGRLVRVDALVTWLLLTLFGFVAGPEAPALAQPSESSNPSDEMVLNVTALDAQGHPVTDLSSGDFRIYDNGKPQQITSFNTGQSSNASAPTTLIFFDLLNSSIARREYVVGIIVHTLEPLDQGNSVYLYLLTLHGDLYPVRGLPALSEAHSDARPTSRPDSGWTREIHSMMDQAIREVNSVRPMDARDAGIRALATFQALGDVAEHLTQMPGPKTIIWVTAGVPNWLDYPYGCKDITFSQDSASYVAGKCTHECRHYGECIDYAPFFQHLSMELSQSNTVIYSVEEALEGVIPPADRGTERDTLQQLADLTGGRMYRDGELDKAITQSLDDAPTRYRLAYNPPPPNGKYHKLRVECTRKGVHIEAQQGYYPTQPQRH